MPIADVRVFCVGRCGAFMIVPFASAVNFLTEEGEWGACVRRAYYCQKCIDWFNWVTETLEVK